MNRFSTATRLNATKSEDSHWIYKEALMNVLKGANISRPPETQIEVSPLENSIFLQQTNNNIQSEASLSRSHIFTTEASMRSKEFTDAPGELDMLVGFFIMNAACIVFFLMFGMCVICSCMRKKPNFFTSSKSDKEPTSSKRRLLSPKSVSPKPSIISTLPVTNPNIKPTFKAIVTKAIKSEDFRKMAKQQGNNDQRRCSATSPFINETTHLLRRASEKVVKNETIIDIEPPNGRCHSVTRQVQIQVEPTDIPFDKELTPEDLAPPPTSIICPSCHPTPPEADHVCDCNCENEIPATDAPEIEDGEDEASVIRQNLLGPLTFDDLYYT